MTQDELKKAVGWAALQYVQPGTIVGVGTGSTAAHFIDALGTMKGQIEGAVSSSDASTEKLKSLGIHVFDLNEVDSLGIYVDGADEINGHMQMIKGGGAALTREKIIASVAEKFICIADASKQVDILGKFPLPVEVIPMARSAVARQLVKLGGRPEYRLCVVTDNGNVILDVVGAKYLQRNVDALAANGRVVVIGLQGGRTGELDLGVLLAKRGAVIATSLRARLAREKATIVKAVREHVWPLVEQGRVRPIVQERLPLNRAADAHRILEASDHIGKVLLTI